MRPPKLLVQAPSWSPLAKPRWCVVIVNEKLAVQQNGRNVTFQAHLATAAAGHHGGAGWCPWARLMRTRAD